MTGLELALDRGEARHVKMAASTTALGCFRFRRQWPNSSSVPESLESRHWTRRCGRLLLASDTSSSEMEANALSVNKSQCGHIDKRGLENEHWTVVQNDTCTHVWFGGPLLLPWLRHRDVNLG